MKLLHTILLLFSISAFSQNAIEINLSKETPLEADTFIGTNNFNSLYYITTNVFYKTEKNNTLSYNNLQLGELTSANSFNPLKINLFYRDFNTVIILDNRLAEIFKIDFNTIKDYKNVSHISTGFDNTIWVFNQDTQQLELFDYRTKITRAKTLPIDNNVLDLKSNYNYCYLLTESFIFVYNYFGSLVKKLKNNGYTQLIESNESLYFKRDNKLFYLKKDNEEIIPINVGDILIPQFFVTNETLYIYDNKTLKEYQTKNQ